MVHQPPLILVILLVLSGVVCAYLAAWAQVRHRQSAALEFSLLTWASALYSLGYAIEITRNRLEDILIAIRIEYLGLAFIPALFILFTMHFIRGKPLGILPTAASLIIPLITLALVWTVEQHGWYYREPHIESGLYFPVLVFERGPWYFVQLTYLLVAALLMIIALVWHGIRRPPPQRIRFLLIAGGAAAPLVEGFFYSMGLLPRGMDAGPLALSVTVLLFALALFRFGLFEIVPAARELALDSVREGFFVMDHSGKVLDLNRAARQLKETAQWKIGYPIPRNGPLSEWIAGTGFEVQPVYEFASREVDGHVRYFRVRAYPLSDWRGWVSATAFLISDISETTRLIQRLDEQASTDELTGLLNRRALIQNGNELVANLNRKGEMLAVLLMDLDHFKEINDTFGHERGDAVLRWVGRCLLQHLREEDIFGRYGGDEFVIFLPGADFTGAQRVAERIRRGIEEGSNQLELGGLKVSASIGVCAVTSTTGITLDELLHCADQALYRAKSSGRNRVVG